MLILINEDDERPETPSEILGAFQLTEKAINIYLA